MKTNLICFLSAIALTFPAFGQLQKKVSCAVNGKSAIELEIDYSKTWGQRIISVKTAAPFPLPPYWVLPELARTQGDCCQRTEIFDLGVAPAPELKTYTLVVDVLDWPSSPTVKYSIRDDGRDEDLSFDLACQ